MSDYILAQLNIAKMRYTYEAAEMADFVNNLDRINQLAEQAPGFIWRYLGDETEELEVFGPGILVNCSTWEDIDSLHHYIFHTAHVEIMRRRKEWFDGLEIHSVMWWHRGDKPPALAEAKRRLEMLGADGDSEEAFSFRKRFARPAVG